MNLNIEFLKEDLVGMTTDRPPGTLSGHVIGNVFDELVFRMIEDSYPLKTFRQYQFLNKLYLENSELNNVADRFKLIEPEALAYF